MRAILICILVLVSLTARAQTVQYENGTVEKTLRWGAYTVRFFHYVNEALADAVQIRDSKGRVMREVRAPRIVDSDAVFEDVNRDGVPELRVLAWTRGAYCCYTEFFFDRTRGVRNILIFAGREYHSKKGSYAGHPFRDLNGDGRFEIVLENDAIAQVNGSTHGPTTALVLEPNGSRYVDATRRFARFAIARALEYRAQIGLDADGRFDAAGGALDPMAGYYANALLAGQDRAARAWLIRHGGPRAQEWLRAAEPRIRAALQSAACRVGGAQARLMYVPPPGARVPGSGCSSSTGF
jgi:hypothetical protein